jgi:hypothetical protein
MPMKPMFLDFARLIAAGNAAEASRRLLTTT